MKKKVIIYADSLLPSGGRERVIANLIHAWKDRYDLTLLVKDSGESFYPLPECIKIISLSCPLTLNLNNRVARVVSVATNLFKSVKLLKHYLSSSTYDYIYTATPLNSFEVMCAMKEPNKKLVVSEHASIDSFNTIYTWMKKVVYPKAYYVSVPNKMDTEIYKNEGCNAIYIPHLVTFKAIEKGKLEEKIFLNVGRLTLDKQQSKLISMWSKVPNKGEWKLLIVGDGEEKNHLEEQIESLNLKDSVTLLPSTKSINEYYKRATCFLLTSRCEGFGMVLLEAMAFGVPCISFDCPSGPRDIILNNTNGFLIDNNDEVGFTKAIMNIIDMKPERLQLLGNGAFATVQEWDNEYILDKWDLIFR